MGMAAVEVGQNGDLTAVQHFQQDFVGLFPGAVIIKLLVLAQNDPADPIQDTGQLQ